MIGRLGSGAKANHPIVMPAQEVEVPALDIWVDQVGKDVVVNGDEGGCFEKALLCGFQEGQALAWARASSGVFKQAVIIVAGPAREVVA